MVRYGYTIYGCVQSVGFRPFVFREATKLGLTGMVRNTSDGVYVEVQGDPSIVDVFADSIEKNAPVLAKITKISTKIVPLVEQEDIFTIGESIEGTKNCVLVSPDIATCVDCLNDIRAEGNRYYTYPFTNCVSCGPRYTILSKTPYDRINTTMKCFSMCKDCQKEYNDMSDRRFHAQPNACPVCGPKLWLSDKSGREEAQGYEAICGTAAMLSKGNIVAVKGLGGFHLACDAFNPEVIKALRRRKERPDKPLAVMLPTIEMIYRVADITRAEAVQIQSAQAPIVIVKPKLNIFCEDIAPDVCSIGVMLPYTPLHHMILDEMAHLTKNTNALVALVMTSGNISGEPLLYKNRDALEKLSTIADSFLFHDRDIFVPIDDSVIRIDLCSKEFDSTEEQHFFRRARGYTPMPITVSTVSEGGPSVLALGAELKNTICYTRGKDFFVSQHLGDIKTVETEQFFCRMIEHLKTLLDVVPESVVCDMHPDYRSSLYAEECGLPILKMQHHFAHGYSVLAEHSYSDPALILALDGTGYGLDGTIWGGELLYANPKEVKGITDMQGVRIGRLTPFYLPGGEKAIYEPWRLVSGFLALPECSSFLGSIEKLWKEDHVRYAKHEAIMSMIASGTVVETSSCGRLFDAVAALLGVCEHITYEGQAAILLEQCQDVHCTEEIMFPLVERNSLYELDTKEFFEQLMMLWEQGIPVAVLSRQFHLGLIEGLAELALAGAIRTGIKTVALSGGVFHNKTVASLLPEALIRRGLTPLMHRNVPPGDGGISLGQAYWARLVLS